MRNLQKYVDNETYVMPENAHMFFLHAVEMSVQFLCDNSKMYRDVS
jgi:hypothetical protein